MGCVHGGLILLPPYRHRVSVSSDMLGLVVLLAAHCMAVIWLLSWDKYHDKWVGQCLWAPGSVWVLQIMDWMPLIFFFLWRGMLGFLVLLIARCLAVIGILPSMQCHGEWDGPWLWFLRFCLGIASNGSDDIDLLGQDLLGFVVLPAADCLLLIRFPSSCQWYIGWGSLYLCVLIIFHCSTRNGGRLLACMKRHAGGSSSSAAEQAEGGIVLGEVPSSAEERMNGTACIYGLSYSAPDSLVMNGWYWSVVPGHADICGASRSRLSIINKVSLILPVAMKWMGRPVSMGSCTLPVSSWRKSVCSDKACWAR